MNALLLLGCAVAAQAPAAWELKLPYQTKAPVAYGIAIEIPDQGPDPQNSAYLDANSKTAKVSMNGDLDSGQDIFLAAGYYFGTPPAPISPVASDYSNSFYAYRDVVDQQLWRNGHQYTYLKPHKPASVQPYTEGVKPWSPPPDAPNNRGDWFAYQLLDLSGDGMPGVWVQERFYVENANPPIVPADFYTNLDTGFHWTTQRKGYIDPWLSSKTVADGVFDKTDNIHYYKSLTITCHEYWAATDVAAEHRGQYVSRTIPGTDPPVKRWLGVFVGAFTIVIDYPANETTHDAAGRCSPNDPP